VAHLSPEQLAALASEPTLVPSADEREHLAACPSCSAALAELGEVVGDIRAARPAEVREPRPQVWAAIERELDADGPVDPVVPLRPAAARRRFHPARLAVAAAVGLLVGVGGTLGVLSARTAEGPALLASTTLAPLPGETGEGTAELVREDDTVRLRVHAALGSSPSGDYHEVWLINGDGRRMYALGVLPSSGDASYWLPAPLGSRLDGYETVDISLEPEDGDAAHSQHSLVRGRLPA
jgi:anti-sigma-K factor RskA